MKIKDSVVVVTGASSGIGLATATLLTYSGAKVALVARSARKLQVLAKKLPQSLAIPTDMTRENEIRKLIKKVQNHFGRIDILINNAGWGYDATLEEIEIDKYRQLFELNVIGALVAMQTVIPIMRKQGGGMIVNISSGTSLMSLPNMSAYSSSKRALNGLTLTAREELARDKIVVSVVYPYITLTDFDKNMLKNKGKKPDRFSENDRQDLPPFDSAEYVAKKIWAVIKSEKAEQFAHGWMKKMR